MPHEQIRMLWWRLFFDVCAMVSLIVLVGAIINPLPFGRDDTDPGVWGNRSGMGLYTDARTGCQYLSAGGSGITPRLDRDGKHICN